MYPTGDFFWPVGNYFDPQAIFSACGQKMTKPTPFCRSVIIYLFLIIAILTGVLHINNKIISFIIAHPFMEFDGSAQFSDQQLTVV